jgi:hypothetical protein
MAIMDGPIVSPDGVMLPGDLRSMGIGSMPVDIPVPPDPELPPSTMNEPPPGVPVPQPEAPYGADLPSIGLPSALTNFFQTGKLPPPQQEPGTAPRSPFDMTPVPAPAPVAKAPAKAKGGKAAAPQAPAQAPQQGAPDLGVPTLGMANAYTQGAYGDQIRAEAGVGEAEGAQQDAMAEARTQAQETIKAQQIALEKSIQRTAEIYQEKTAAVQAAEKEVDSFKVDPQRFWKDRGTARKIGFWISAALAGLGEALQGKSGNPVLGMLDEAIKQDISLQMDQRDSLRKKAGRMAGERDALERFSNNRIAQEQYLLGQAYTMAAREVENAGSQHAGEVTRAKSLAAATELKTKAAGAFTHAAEVATNDARQREQNAMTDRHHRAQIGLGYSNLNAENFRHAERIALERDKVKEETAIALANASGKDGESMMKLEKDNEERVLFDPATGRRILKPEGRAMVQEADRLDALAEEAKDPQQAAQLVERAKELRGQAEILHPVRVASDRARATNESISAFQSAIGITDEIRGLRKKHGAKWLATQEGDQAMQSLSMSLSMMLKQGFQMGALDKGSIMASLQMQGGDPTKVTAGDISKWLGAQGTDKPLETLANTLERAGHNTLGSVGVKGSGDSSVFKFRRMVEGTRPELDKRLGLLKGKTPGEFDAGMSPAARAQIEGKTPEERRELAARGATAPTIGGGAGRELRDRPSDSSKYSGLSAEQETAMDRMLEDAKKTTDGVSDPVARRKIRADVAEARKAIVEAATSDWKTREGASIAMLTALSKEAPDLYKEALTKIPTGTLATWAQGGDTAADEVLTSLPKDRLSTAAQNYLQNRPSAPISVEINDDTLRRLASKGDEKSVDILATRAAKQNPDLEGVIARAKTDPAAREALKVLLGLGSE